LKKMNVTTISAQNYSTEEMRQLKEISGENVFACYQCGNCSASCPVSNFMDLLPSQVIRLAQLGAIDEIIEKNTIWICAACITCRARCPKGVDFAKIAEALRAIVLRKKQNYVHLNKIPEASLKTLPQIALVGNFRKFTL